MVFLGLIIASSLALATDCHELLRDALLRNEFVTGRNLQSYEYLLGNGFMSRLIGLPPGSHVLDLGGGDGVAAREMAARGNKVTLVALSAKHPAKAEGGFRPLYGQLFEDYALENLSMGGPVALAVDVWGVAAYTTRLTEAFRRVHQLLAKDGDYFVLVGTFLPRVSVWRDASGTIHRSVDSSMYSSEVILKDGRQLPVPEYLKLKLRGFKIQSTYGKVDILRLTKTSDAFSLPELEYLGDSTDPKIHPLLKVFPETRQKPPARLFRER